MMKFALPMIIVLFFLVRADELGATDTAHLKMSETMLDEFILITTSSEFKGQNDFMIRYESNIDISIVNAEKSIYNRSVTIIKNLSRLINRSITIDDESSQGINIFFANNLNEYEYLLSELNIHVDIFKNQIFLPCFTYSISNRDFGIVSSFVVIPTYFSEEYTIECMNEEILQSFGLTNDFHEDYEVNSILSNSDRINTITNYDKQLLSTLYDERLKSGMTSDEIRRILQP